jgi:7,8-dihydro-6-hydroxymethylpterin dimethyltransferase
LKIDGKVTPLTGMIDPQVLIGAGRNTIVTSITRRFAPACSNSSRPTTRRKRVPARCRICSCCLPQLAVPGEPGYRNIFRVIVMHFIDAHAFDVRSVKKSRV